MPEHAHPEEELFAEDADRLFHDAGELTRRTAIW
jgi:hypothetical protein